jgi:predicted chitinase
MIVRIHDRYQWNVIIKTYDDASSPMTTTSSGCSIEENMERVIVINIPSCSEQDTLIGVTSNDVKVRLPDSLLTIYLDEFEDSQTSCSDPVGNTYSLLYRILSSERTICPVCSEDITVTINKLNQVFPESGIVINEEIIDLINRILSEEGYTTCRSNAHFFSQTGHETVGFTKFVESPYYSMKRWFEVFLPTCNKPYTEYLVSQDFWDNGYYLDFFPISSYQFDTTSTQNKYKAINQKKYQWTRRLNRRTCFPTRWDVGDTIVFPQGFSRNNSIGTYSYRSYTQVEKDSCAAKMFSYTYGGLLGNRAPETRDGYNYRGRGAVHLTGRQQFIDASTGVERMYKEKYDYGSNFRLVTTDVRSILLTAGYYFNLKIDQSGHKSYRRNIILNTDNVSRMTSYINGGQNGYDDRLERYNLLRSSLYSCQ